MKLKIKKKKNREKSLYEDAPEKSKKSRDRDDEDDAPVLKKSSNSWMIRDRGEQKAAAKKQQAMSRSGGRPNELWIRDGESRIIQFLSNDPIAAIYRYNVKNGKNFSRVTQPGPGEKDLMKAAGLRAGLIFYYPVRDKTGYVDKNKKRHRNIDCFLAAGIRVESQIEKIREKVGDITKVELDFSRSGAGTDTTYNFFMENRVKAIPEGSTVTKKMTKEFEKSYAPPNVEEQRALLHGISDKEDDDED